MHGRDRRDGEHGERVAALWHEGEDVVVFCTQREAVQAALSSFGARLDPRRDGAVLVSSRLVEELGSELDRLGYRWALERSDAPRTWAERLFAETPARLHQELYLVLYALLSGRGGDTTHLAVLQSARSAQVGLVPDQHNGLGS
jgi:hypothetical protein